MTGAVVGVGMRRWLASDTTTSSIQSRPDAPLHEPGCRSLAARTSAATYRTTWSVRNRRNRARVDRCLCSLAVLVPGAGIEPARSFRNQDFKPSPAVLRSERAGVNCGFQLQFRRSTFPLASSRTSRWPARTGVLSSNCQSRHATGAARPRRSARTAVHPATSR